MTLDQNTLAEIAAELKYIAGQTTIRGLTEISLSINGCMSDRVCASGSRPSPSYEFLCAHAPSVSEAIEKLRTRAGTLDTEIAQLEERLAALKATKEGVS